MNEASDLIDEEQRQQLWDAITRVRDARPRRSDDADTKDIVDELIPVVGRIAQAIAARGTGPRAD